MAPEGQAGGPNDRNTLVAKHKALLERHQRLLERHRDSVAEGAGIMQLGWWGLKTAGSGLALVRSSALVMSNERFKEIERTSGGLALWRPLDAGRASESVAFGLREAVRAEADALLKGDSPERLSRWREVEGPRTIDVICQRSSEVQVATVGVLVNDVTARAREEDELQAARQSNELRERMRLIGELASGVAHDLNNTLNVMLLRLSIVAADADCVRAQGPNLEVLARSVDGAIDMVRRLQEFARRRQDRPVGSVNLAEVVAQAIEMARSGVEGSSIHPEEFVIDVDVGQLPAVAGAPDEVRRVLINLLLNARAAMPHGGTVQIRALEEASCVVLSIADEGPGVPSADFARIFEPFYTTKGADGTGLGLSIAYGVMGRLGGSIEVANRRQGGALFTLRFPIAAEREKRPAKPNATPESGRPVAKPVARRVLLVDDDRENVEAGREALARLNVTVEVAISGPDAIDFFRAGARFDLVLCDLGMPRMNGWEVAERIQEIAPGTPVYLLTGWGLEVSPDDPLRRDVAGVLAKPLRMDDLERILAEPGVSLEPFSGTGMTAPEPGPAKKGAARPEAGDGSSGRQTRSKRRGSRG